MIAHDYPEATVIVDVSVRGKCDIRCVQARGDECACECGGDNHGGLRNSNWTQVGETTLVENGEKTRRRTYKVGYAV
ncbi:hypothetical protein A6A08_08415 [Nocardiopsis sp. TSRI0078]|nr:hypothetical protein A6A08_08415 [Nocardiopsis sp. TSRI0078]